MPISPARKTAYTILLRLESGREFAVDLLQRPEVSDLKDPDRRLTMEIVMGVERWRGELDFQTERLTRKPVVEFDPEVRTILRMGMYQIRFLERVPKHAVVDDAVELAKAARKRSAAGLVNAVLRKCESPKERWSGGSFEDLSAENLESVRQAFPAWILQRWAANFGGPTRRDDLTAQRLAHACLVTPRTTLRILDGAADPRIVQRELEAEGVATSPCRFARAHGLVVESGQVQNTRASRESRVAIQDEASQLVAELVAPERRQRILDVCAAPGMKAGQLAQMLGAGELIACDRSASRLRTLAALLPRQVPAGVRFSIVRLDATDSLPFNQAFDRILLDAPCSGTGTLGRNPEIKWRLSPYDIARLADLQTKMLRSALCSLAPGGRLVYSTCSLEPEENEQVVGKILSESRGFRTLGVSELSALHPHLAPLFDSRGFFRTRPDVHAMDGFTAAIIVREGKQ